MAMKHYTDYTKEPKDKEGVGMIISIKKGSSMPSEWMDDEEKSDEGEGNAEHSQEEIDKCLAEIEKTKKLLFEKDGCKVYEVNGEEIRNHIDIDFLGGHHWVEYENSQEDKTCHDFIPENEIWVDEALPDKLAIAKHELVERPQMEDGKKYEPAHSKATAEEQKFRNKIKDDKASLSEQISMIKGKKY